MGANEARNRLMALIDDRERYGNEALKRQEEIRQAAEFVRDRLSIVVDPEKATCDGLCDIRFAELPPLVFTRLYDEWCMGLNVDRTKPGFIEWWRSPFNSQYRYLRPSSIYADSLRDFVSVIHDDEAIEEIVIFPEVEDFMIYQIVDLDTLNNRAAFHFDGKIHAVVPNYWHNSNGVGVLVYGVRARDLMKYAQVVPGWKTNV